MPTVPRNRRFFIFAFFIFAVAFAPSAAMAKKKPRPPTLPQKIDALLAGAPTANGFVGVEVYSIDQGKVLYQRDADKLFVPASNTKIFTTATALATLGPDYRFRTTLETNGRLDKFGRLTGDLFLVGRGDPNLSGRALPFRPQPEHKVSPTVALEKLADQLAQQGVRQIDGDLVGDDSYFVNEPYGDNWGQDDLQWWWGAPVGALTVADNVFTVDITPAEKEGERALIRLEPFSNFFEIRNFVTTSAAQSEKKIQVQRDPGSFRLTFWGTIPLEDKGETMMLAVYEPALYAVSLFRRILESKGVHILGATRTLHCELWEAPACSHSSRAAARRLLAEHFSAPLIEDLKVINKVSQNLHAEIVLRLLGAERRQEGSVRKGLEVVKEFLKSAGLEEKQFSFTDGSGLSTHNLVSPHAMVTLLKFMHQQPYRDQFIDLLPIAGLEGTLEQRFKGSVSEHRIRAKTGTLTHINALSGYATTPQNEKIIFSIMLNHHLEESRVAVKTIDGIVDLILQHREPPARPASKKSSAKPKR